MSQTILNAIRAGQPATATDAIKTALSQKMQEALARERRVVSEGLLVEAKVKLKCNECGKTWTTSTTASDPDCPSCGGVDYDVLSEATGRFCIAAKSRDGKVTVMLGNDEAKLSRVYNGWKQSGNMYPRLGQGKIPASMSDAEVLKRTAKQYGVPESKVEFIVESAVLQGAGMVESVNDKWIVTVGLSSGEIDKLKRAGFKTGPGTKSSKGSPRVDVTGKEKGDGWGGIGVIRQIEKVIGRELVDQRDVDLRKADGSLDINEDDHFSVTCKVCEGSGYVEQSTKKCSACRGSGEVSRADEAYTRNRFKVGDWVRFKLPTPSGRDKTVIGTIKGLKNGQYDIKTTQDGYHQKDDKDIIGARDNKGVWHDVVSEHYSMPLKTVQRVFDENGNIGETEILCGISNLKVNGQGSVVSYLGEAAGFSKETGLPWEFHDDNPKFNAIWRQAVREREAAYDKVYEKAVGDPGNAAEARMVDDEIYRTSTDPKEKAAAKASLDRYAKAHADAEKAASAVWQKYLPKLKAAWLEIPGYKAMYDKFKAKGLIREGISASEKESTERTIASLEAQLQGASETRKPQLQAQIRALKLKAKTRVDK